MSTRGNLLVRWIRWIFQVLVFAGFAAGVVVLMLWLSGKFSPKVPASKLVAQSETSQTQQQSIPVELVELPLTESAVGTIRAVHETTIGSKLLARVVEVNLKAGQKVRAGDVLIRLDDTDLRARLQQAQANVSAAEAAYTQASADEKRYAQLVESRTVSQQQYDNTVTAMHTAKANLRRAEAAVHESQATLDCATIQSPIDATVIDKKVDVGDMVSPGQPLVTLYDPTHMQLVASVRESLTSRLKVGQDIGVRVEGLNKTCSGTITEKVPEAQSASRTFQVKVSGPCPPGIYSGMFGRILIPLDKEKALVIPRRAIRDVGQLELVEVAGEKRTDRRAIRTGRDLTKDEVKMFSDKLMQGEPYVIVLSGLSEGERVVLPAALQEAPRD
jgi:membrane fusion protein, multidrug efflux system